MRLKWNSGVNSDSRQILPIIDKNIPIPSRRLSYDSPINWKFWLKQMEVGDSFIWSGLPNFRTAASGLGYVLVTRQETQQTYRVWRVK